MALSVNSNFAALSTSALTSMKSHQSAMGTSISRISAGTRLTSAKDGAADYVAAKKIQTDADGYNALYRGVQNGSSALTVADKGISSILDTLRSMRELALNYDNLDDNAKGSQEGTALANQFDALNKSLGSLTSVSYNGQNLLAASQTFNFTTTLDSSNAGGVEDNGTYYISVNNGKDLLNSEGSKLGSFNKSGGDYSSGTITIDGTLYDISNTSLVDHSSKIVVGKYTKTTATAPGHVEMATATKLTSYTLSYSGTSSIAAYKTEDNNQVKIEAIKYDSSTSSAKAGQLQAFKINGSTYWINNTKLYDGSNTSKAHAVGSWSPTADGSVATFSVYTTETRTFDTALSSGSDYTVSWDNISDLVGGLKVSDAAGIKTAIEKVSAESAKIGGGLAALDYISTSLQNITSSEYEAYETISDVDMATEMTNYVKNNIYSQAAQAMIAQANQSMAQVLNLLQ